MRLKTPKSRFTVPGAAPRARRLRAYSRIRCVVISLARTPPKKLLRFAHATLGSLEAGPRGAAYFALLDVVCRQVLEGKALFV
jgi:hypothetical protein